MRIGIAIILAILVSAVVYSHWETIDDKMADSWNLTIINHSKSLEKTNSLSEKHRGTHLFGRTDSTSYKYLKENNFEWVTLVAWADQDDIDDPIVRDHNGDSLRLMRSDSNWVRRINEAHDEGFKVFVKPHIWMHQPSSGKWRSDIFPTSEENWELWKESYRNFILRFARISESTKAEMFCVGTELTRLSDEKSAFWKELIQEVRAIYSGKITYAANWYVEYETVDFWDELDYIGIQAYFPLADNTYPDLKEITDGWKKPLRDIKRVHKKYKRKVIFTEMGYKSTAGSAIRPWEWIYKETDLDDSFSAETQANCYQAFFDKVWMEDWFAGVHIWQIRSSKGRNNKFKNRDFTPRGKPAEKIIAREFSKH